MKQRAIRNKLRHEQTGVLREITPKTYLQEFEVYDLVFVYVQAVKDLCRKINKTLVEVRLRQSEEPEGSECLLTVHGLQPDQTCDEVV